MNLIKWIKQRIKQSLERQYYCDGCCDKSHWHWQPSIFGLACSFIGIATALQLDGLPSLDEKKYCEMCHP